MFISIKAVSSRGDSFYTVDFFLKHNALSVLCDCPAGEWGKFCKHKWQLLNGDESMLAESSESDKLAEVNKLALERGLNDLYQETERLEQEKKILTREQKKEKDTLKKALSKKVVLTKEQFSELNNALHEKDMEVGFVSYLISKEKEILEQKLKNGFCI